MKKSKLLGIDGNQIRRYHWMEDAKILDNEASFCSSQFSIKYNQDVINLNELCTFRLELSAYPKYCQEEVYLKA